MLQRRGAFHDDRYVTRKQQALQRDPSHNNFVWIADSHKNYNHRRDIMPNCVLHVVRSWYPNPAKVAYMGHMWE